MRLRPLQLGDEAAACEAQRELATEAFTFLLDWVPAEPWAGYLARLDRRRRGVEVPDGRVPATFLGAYVGAELVGRVSIRHALNEHLAEVGGHIGYAVRPAYRRRGHATEILRQALVIARGEGIDRVLVTCAVENRASATIIERLGGQLEDVREDRDGTRMRRYWMTRAPVLDRLAPWTTTGVGSLPHASGAAAAAHAVKAYALPFCPQLPGVEGDMIAEWRGTRARPRAWEALLGELARRPPAHGVVKLQVTGPLTLACALGSPVEAADAIAGRLAAEVAEQVAVLERRGLSVVLVVDEPLLDRVAAPGIERVWEPLRGVGAAWGLHVCCPVPWPVIVRAAPDVLSFDLTLGLGDEGAAALRTLLAGGGRVAWGIVAPDRPEGDAEAPALLDAALRATGATGRQSLLTPTCGTGIVSVAREMAVAEAVGAIARGRRGAEGAT
ncbi:MAG TPA: GNAT family N-acetyltransferase [Baekduia sp.]